MAMYPNVSIIMPHYNQNDALEKCVASLKQQSYPLDKIEIIIVDNGSKKLPEIKNDVFKNLVVMEEFIPGPGPARNAGVGRSKSEFLFFIDTDCIADSDWVRSGVAILGSNEAAILGGDVKIANSGSDNMHSIEAYENVFAFQQETYINKKGFSVTCNLATSRVTFDQVGLFPGIDVSEDRAWGAQALSKGFNFSYCPDMIIYHPARETFKEIFDKWARHTRHDFSELKGESFALPLWVWRTFLVLASIPIHSFKVIASSRLQGFRPKIKAIMALATIRFFRVGYMLRMLFSKKFRNQDVSWNQE